VMREDSVGGRRLSSERDHAIVVIGIARRVSPPGPPQIRTCGFPASGSSRRFSRWLRWAAAARCTAGGVGTASGER
jgi:hypothetical protein